MEIKRNRKLRFAALLTVGAMWASLTACGSAQKQTADQTTAQETRQAAAGQADQINAPAAETAAESRASGEFVPALDTDKEVTLNMVGSWGNFEALEAAAQDFEKYYPNVEIVYTQLKNFTEDLTNRAATGEDLDIFMTNWWNNNTEDQAEIYASYAEDLNEAGLDLSLFRQEAVEGYVMDGKLCALPIYAAPHGYMVNLDLLKEAGLEVPQTWDDFMHCCETLQAAGYEHPILAHSSYFGRSALAHCMNLIRKGEEPDQAFEDTLDLLDELAASGYIMEDSDDLKDNYEALILRFFEGDVPFACFSSSNYSGTKKREAKSEAFGKNPFAYAFISSPYDDESVTYYNQLNAISFSVYKDSAQVDYANELLRFLSEPEEMRVLAEVKNMPTYSAVNGNELFPYLDRSSLSFTHMTEGLTMIDEEAALESLSHLSHEGIDHAEALEKFRSYYALRQGGRY